MNRFFTADDQRVARIVAALKAHHRIGLLGQQINDFTFTFIAPRVPSMTTLQLMMLFPLGHPLALSLHQPLGPGNATPGGTSATTTCQRPATRNRLAERRLV